MPHEWQVKLCVSLSDTVHPYNHLPHESHFKEKKWSKIDAIPTIMRNTPLNAQNFNINAPTTITKVLRRVLRKWRG
jgi:hypothetical protein